MKQFHLFSFLCFPLFALPPILINANEIFVLLPDFIEYYSDVLAFIVYFPVLLFHVVIFLIFSYVLYRWVGVVVKVKDSSLLDYLDNQKKDLVSTMIVLEVVVLVVVLVVYVPGVREVLVTLGKLL